MIKFKLTVAELCRYAVAKLDQSQFSSEYINGLSSIKKVREQTAVFVFHQDTLKRILKTKVKVILMDKNLKQDFKTNKIILTCEDIKLSFISFLSFLKEYLNNRNLKRIKIGNNTKIYPNVYIEGGVSIGDNVIIYPNTYICQKSYIKNNVIIESGVKIGFEGFSYYDSKDGKNYKIPHIGGVCIGEDVHIGANTTIDRGVIDMTKIGKKTKIDKQVHVGHNVQIGSRSYIAAHTTIGGSVKIGDRVKISGHVAIVDHIKIQKDVKIFAHSLVTKNIGKMEEVWGMPARNFHFEKKKWAILNRIARIYLNSKFIRNFFYK